MDNIAQAASLAEPSGEKRAGTPDAERALASGGKGSPPHHAGSFQTLAEKIIAQHAASLQSSLEARRVQKPTSTSLPATRSHQHFLSHNTKNAQSNRVKRASTAETSLMARAVRKVSPPLAQQRQSDKSAALGHRKQPQIQRIARQQPGTVQNNNKKRAPLVQEAVSGRTLVRRSQTAETSTVCEGNVAANRSKQQQTRRQTQASQNNNNNAKQRKGIKRRAPSENQQGVEHFNTPKKFHTSQKLLHQQKADTHLRNAQRKELKYSWERRIESVRKRLNFDDAADSQRGAAFNNNNSNMSQQYNSFLNSATINSIAVQNNEPSILQPAVLFLQEGHDSIPEEIRKRSEKYTKGLLRGQYDVILDRFDFKEIKSLMLLGDEWKRYVKRYLRKRLNDLKQKLEELQQMHLTRSQNTVGAEVQPAQQREKNIVKRTGAEFSQSEIGVKEEGEQDETRVVE